MPPKPSAQEANRTTNGGLDLYVNGESIAAPHPCTIGRLLTQLGLGGRRVAVAVDRGVIPRSSFDTHQLVAGDRVEILEAVGGG